VPGQREVRRVLEISPGVSAQNLFRGWFHWATRSRLPELISVAYTIKRHFDNIITYIRKPISNAAAEGINSKIQMIKYRARGYRNETRFATAILFHCAAWTCYYPLDILKRRLGFSILKHSPGSVTRQLETNVVVSGGGRQNESTALSTTSRYLRPRPEKSGGDYLAV